MPSLPGYKDILELFKRGATLEAQDKIMELRTAVHDLQDENFSLRERVKQLEAQFELKSKLVFKDRMYWMEEDGVPFCPTCWEDREKPIHLLGGAPGERYRCEVCNFLNRTRKSDSDGA